MGISFGQIPGAGAALRSIIDARSAQQPTRQVQSAVQNLGGQGDGSVENSFQSAEQSEVQVGVSGSAIGATPAAALIALGRTVQSVRENTPTIEQIREGFLQQSEEARARVRVELRGEALGVVSDNEPVQVTRSDEVVSSDARGFFAAVDNVDQALRGQASGAAEASTAESEPPVTDRNEPEPVAETPAPRPERFDVSV
ncbi:MAG: hypothetical protein COA73_16765 [Candidatus Hydrogenedentota bacterium]|nr:MAG: hypothetical protein COA73_16765 [Candidatus Hydrogenedentota bacterium]